MNFYHPDPVSADTITDWYFAPLLPWQQARWDYLTQHYPNLPHAMLFAGNAGTGKRAFVYRFIAWVLCLNKSPNGSEQRACGQCDSCQWLMSGTHPNLLIVPQIASLHASLSETEGKKSAKASDKPKKTTLADTSPVASQSAVIKIDEVRALQGFVQQQSQGTRFVVIHQADNMTLAAANALLKTLEEPAQNVLLMLLSDNPSRLLPTVRSRLQGFEVSKVTSAQGSKFLQSHFLQNSSLQNHLKPEISTQTTTQNLTQVLALSNNAPFVAMDMLTSPWYQRRQVWLNTWQALRSGMRQPIQASDYWQQQLSLSDFLYLSQLILQEMARLDSRLPTLQADLDWTKITPPPSMTTLHLLQQTIEQIWQDRTQHLQDKLCYDKLMARLANT